MNKYFEICLKLSKKASKIGEVPIGAVIVLDGKIIAKAYNLREKKHDITAHAEILAIKKASKLLKRWNLKECELYVSLEPCSMCASVIQQARISNVYYLCEKLDYKKEYNKTKYFNTKDQKLLIEYQGILSKFFSSKR